MTAPFVISTKWDTCLEWITNWHYPELRGYFTLKSLLHSGLKQVMSLFTLGPPLCHLGQWLIFYWPKNFGASQRLALISGTVLVMVLLSNNVCSLIYSFKILIIPFARFGIFKLLLQRNALHFSQYGHIHVCYQLKN